MTPPLPVDPPTPPVGTRAVATLTTSGELPRIELPSADEEFQRAWAQDLATPPRGLPRRRRPRRIVLPRILRRRRTLVAAAVVLLTVLGAAVGGGYLVSESLGEQVKRVPDVFEHLDPQARPAPGRSTTFLLVGTDSRSTEPTPAGPADAASRRGDLLMIARLNADRTVAAVASIPRDTWVDIPGHGQDEINTAYTYGGPSLLIATVEKLTALRIDHFAVIDFSGFRSMVDAVGGIDVAVDTPSSSDDVFFHRGSNHLDGRAALAYVRQRSEPGGDDPDRAQRELGVLRALVVRVVEQHSLSSPAGTYTLLEAASRSVSVDDTLDNAGLRTLVSTLHDLEPTDISFVRAPVGEVGQQGTRPVVLLDVARADELWAALRDDHVAFYAQAHVTDALAPVAP